MKIEVRDLVVRYGRTCALDGVGFDVEPGSVFALVGRNGSGKSSLVKVLLGQRRADAGRVSVGGLDPWRRRAELMFRVGATPETPDAPPFATATELAKLAAPVYPSWDRKGFDERLDRFGLPRDRAFRELSRGQRSLVMLALALAHRPQLLVLDDPTLGLDAVARRFVFEELVGELAERGVTIFLTSHDLTGVERVATHVAILCEARIADEGSLEELRERALEDGLDGPDLEELVVATAGRRARR